MKLWGSQHSRHTEDRSHDSGARDFWAVHRNSSGRNHCELYQPNRLLGVGAKRRLHFDDQRRLHSNDDYA